MISADAAATYNNIANGPVAQNVKDEGAKTTAELSNLANARRTPGYKAATGQPLTHYHSFFSELLSWKNPRASGIAYASIVSLILSIRYLDVIRWGFKLTWMTLAITIAAEVAGKAILNQGFATQLRPRQYYTVPKENLDALIGDVNELINFFVIESQRILFAENISASAAAALAAFLSYYLVKIVPYWGLALIATSVVFIAPLIYTSNQELIDSQLHHASEIIQEQTHQIRGLVQKNTEQATQVTKEYLGDYTAKAQAIIKGAENNVKSTVKGAENNTKTTVRDTDFPAVPKADINKTEPLADEPIKPPTKYGEQEPLLNY
ncbi:Reticulon-domain-containing protein [Podospora australis]|uniref:Reticulon-like protein n=1 Tax=Podospora australis TaxID=1536484 RepID=A0AAN7AGM4_9PEZI|nr:Reticulon-domain-containing protein [Podospora australis]